MNRQTQREQEIYTEILAATLSKNDALEWDSMLQKETYPSFSFSEQPPALEYFYTQLNVPKQSFWEIFFSSKKEKRLSKESEAKQEHEKALGIHKASEQAALHEYETKKAEFDAAQEEYNNSILLWKEQFEAGDGLAVEKYIGVVLANSRYPDGISADNEVFYDAISKTAVVSFSLPIPEDISDIIGYKFVASRKAIDPVLIKTKDKISLFESVIQQITLRTIHELFEGVYVQGVLDAVVFNGWVNGVNKATGKDFSACIISVQAGRKEFEEINLMRVDPKECLRGLKALSAGPLHNLAPVKPIMELNREDKRFVSSVDVLEAMDTDTNLATIPWEDFEHLVRELFGKIFSKDGAEVRVTQASRDGGVDAIAFDSDPIRGGKFVIQAV